DGTKEVGGAVLASTLTTLIVFLPILMIQDTAGQLFADIAIAIMASVGLSMIVSLTVIPSIGRVILKRRSTEPVVQEDGTTVTVKKGFFARLPDMIQSGLQ